ncbi:MAG: pseudouridine synthase [Clostridia bacterium]|nr:pseudouridine synthase [Clostridia bacterium]
MNLLTLYLTPDIRVVEKPPGAGVLRADCPRDDRRRENTVEAMLEHSGEAGLPCHRLDVHTGGTLLLALRPQVREDAKLWFANNLVYREYHAVVVGRAPARITARHYAVKNPKTATVMLYGAPRPGAKIMLLSGERVGMENGLSLLKIVLKTGRTHQIRAQLAKLGLPVLGDDKYGDWAANKAHRVRHPQLWHTALGFEKLPPPYDYLNGVVVRSKPGFQVKILPRSEVRPLS